MGGFILPFIAGAVGATMAFKGKQKQMYDASYIKPTTGPQPTTVMAAERAELDRGLKKKRQAASVMGGDYGALNVQQNKLGT